MKDLGLKKIAVLWLNNDWGKATYGLFEGRVKEIGAEIVANEAYLADEKDFRSSLTRVRDSNPDGIALISYQADGALIAQQIKESGPGSAYFWRGLAAVARLPQAGWSGGGRYLHPG